jgi:hypothetical protein
MEKVFCLKYGKGILVKIRKRYFGKNTEKVFWLNTEKVRNLKNIVKQKYTEITVL